MIGAVGYRTKKELKASIGQELGYEETSMFGKEFKSNGTFPMVGPNAHTDRRWYAEITMVDGLIAKVS